MRAVHRGTGALTRRGSLAARSREHGVRPSGIAASGGRQARFAVPDGPGSGSASPGGPAARLGTARLRAGAPAETSGSIRPRPQRAEP